MSLLLPLQKVTINVLKKVCMWSKVHLSELTFYEIHTLAPENLADLVTADYIF